MGAAPLFESRGAKGRLWYKIYVASVSVGIMLIYVYRCVYMPKVGDERRWVWIGLFGAEILFGLYWVLTQSVRWNPIYYQTFKGRLSQRYENDLSSMDILVCTADYKIEPPMLVINTVLSAMTYNYPTEKLSIYVSDDGGSELTFYALFEAAKFSKHWVPYCKMIKIEQRSPEAYFSSLTDISKYHNSDEILSIKKLYEEMENRIETAIKWGRISEEIAKQHKGFSEWNSETETGNHQPIVQILIDGRDCKIVDVEGMPLGSCVCCS